MGRGSSLNLRSVSKSILLLQALSLIFLLFPVVTVCQSEDDVEQSLNYEYEEEVENSLRKLISNPKTATTGLDLKSPETQKMLRKLIRERLKAERMEDHDFHHDNETEDTGAEIKTWDSGACLTNKTRFPTLNLISYKPNSGSSSKATASDIQINKYYGVIRDRFYVRNDGKQVLSFKLEPEELTSQATIRASGWKDEYVLAKGDIYWALKGKHGAHHALDGQSFPLEMQLVHYLKSAGSLENGAKETDGIIVTSILFEATARESPYMEPLARSAISVGFPNKKWKQVHGPLDLKMLFPVDMSYITYRGPYINEPCTMNALWFVFKQPLPVTYSQLQRFRDLRRDNSRRCKGIFLPLSKDEGNVGEKAATSSNGKVYLNVVRKEALNGCESIKVKTSPMLRMIYLSAFTTFMKIFFIRM